MEHAVCRTERKPDTPGLQTQSPTIASHENSPRHQGYGNCTDHRFTLYIQAVHSETYSYCIELHGTRKHAKNGGFITRHTPSFARKIDVPKTIVALRQIGYCDKAIVILQSRLLPVHPACCDTIRCTSAPLSERGNRLLALRCTESKHRPRLYTGKRAVIDGNTTHQPPWASLSAVANTALTSKPSFRFLRSRLGTNPETRSRLRQRSLLGTARASAQS